LIADIPIFTRCLAEHTGTILGATPARKSAAVPLYRFGIGDGERFETVRVSIYLMTWLRERTH